MKQLLFLITLLMSFNVLANPVCDFPYDLSEESGVRELSTKQITPSTRFSSLQKLQIIESAKRILRDNRLPVPRGMRLQDAINELTLDSEGGDAYLNIFRFKGIVYTEIVYYPGGNPYGYVFKGSRVVARRTDGDLLCDGI